MQELHEGATWTKSTTPATDQVDYAEPELLASHRYAEPLIVAGVRCHGGFDDDGAYISPRTANRVPAIAAWQAKHRRDFGTSCSTCRSTPGPSTTRTSPRPGS